MLRDRGSILRIHLLSSTFSPMSNRLSKEHLQKLRKDIPVLRVVRELLGVPSAVVENTLRFECPLCRQLHIVIQQESNVAHCLSCERTFNTIDIVILSKKVDFLKGISLLQGLMGNVSSTQSLPTARGNNEARRQSTPSIGRILSEVASRIQK